jgi:hypothetical protein
MSRDPAYWRAWRATHPEYRERERLATIARHARRIRTDRSVEYARRTSRAVPRLEPLPGHGVRIAFWEDELRLDLAQERHLAILEGRDPDLAARIYRTRELIWHRITTTLEAER